MQKGNVAQHVRVVMDNVIVVSDDDEDKAKDVVNGDSNGDNLYVGHRIKALIFSGVIYFNVRITL